MFVLDHVNYARWLPVFLADRKLLPENKSLFQEFCWSNLTISKSDRIFTNMGFDQAHEQNKKNVKADSGTIGILDNEATLVEWAVSGPQISVMLQKTFSNDEKNDLNFHDHHDDTDTYEKQFREDWNMLTENFALSSNPFSEPAGNLINIVSRVFVSEQAELSIRTVEQRTD